MFLQDPFFFVLRFIFSLLQFIVDFLQFLCINDKNGLLSDNLQLDHTVQTNLIFQYYLNVQDLEET